MIPAHQNSASEGMPVEMLKDTQVGLSWYTRGEVYVVGATLANVLFKSNSARPYKRQAEREAELRERERLEHEEQERNKEVVLVEPAPSPNKQVSMRPRLTRGGVRKGKA